MTHHIEHQYDEILPAAWPGLEIHVVYYCESAVYLCFIIHEKSRKNEYRNYF